MKKLAVIMLGLGILFTSCQQKELDQRVQNNGNVNITVYAADAISVRSSYSATSADGGAANATNLGLRYVLAIYDSSNNLVVDPTPAYVSTAGAHTYNVELTEGEDYTAVVWADLSSSVADNHYDTSNWPTIAYADTYTINDESYDAYFGSQDFTVNGSTVTVTLTRPFAKVRLVTNDWDATNAPAQIKLTYGAGRPETFDVTTGKVGDVVSTATEFTADIDMEYTDETSTTHTLAVDYIFASDSKDDVTLEYAALDENGDVLHSLAINQDIPVQRNYLTTISGYLLSTNDLIQVDFDAEFGGNYDYEIDNSTYSLSPVSAEYDENGYPTVAVDGTLTLSVVDADEIEDEAYNWAWTSSDTEVAEVTNGVVTGIAAGGPVTITATASTDNTTKATTGTIYTCSIDIYVVAAGSDTPAEANAGVKLSTASATCSIDAKTFDVSAYVEQPDDATQTLTYSVDVEETVATIDGETGVVTFVTPGTVVVTVTSDAEESDVDTDNGYAKSVDFTLSVPAGYYDEDAATESLITANWGLNSTQSSSAEWDSSKSCYTVSTTDGSASLGHLTKNSHTSYGSDIAYNVYLDPTNYPIVCFRLTDLGDDTDNISQCHIIIDVSGYAVSDTDKTGRYTTSGGSAQAGDWTNKYTLNDGTVVLVYDLSSYEFKGNSDADYHKITETTYFETWAIKYVDIKDENSETPSEVSWDFYWFQTFASTNALDSYLDEAGFTYTKEN